MRNPLVGYRYAKALVQLALDTNRLDEVKKDIDYLRSQRHPELDAVMSSPIIRGDRKSKIFRAVYKDNVSELTKSFFDLIFIKGREFVMRDIGEAFDDQYNEIKGIVPATITTAVPMKDELQRDLYERVSNLPRYQGKKLNLEVKTDPKIIGGFILNIADNKFDASIRHDLHFIKQEFIQNLYEMKY